MIPSKFTRRAASLALAAAAVVPAISFARSEPARSEVAPRRAVESGEAAAQRAAERRRLRESLQEVLKREALDGARLGVHVLSLDTGEVLFSDNAEELLNPASNVKLVTAAAVLARLGPEYRFPTEFLCAARKRDGCDALYVRGKGDPMLVTERLYGIATELLHRGVRKVGDLVVDDTYFDDVRDGPGWEQERSDRAYLAPAGALSINHNAVGIYVTGAENERGKARVAVEPSSEYFKVDNQVVTVPAKSRKRLNPSSHPDGARQRIVVSGWLPAGAATTVFYKKIDNPPMYAGETLRAIFRERGIEITGRVRLGATPAEARLVHTHLSPPLSEIVRELNKFSNNFIAEQLLKALGAEVKGTPGTWEKGVAATEEVLAELGLAKGSYVMRNGSGLNDINRFSAAQMTRLLAAIHARAGFYPEFAASLGVAARDGTIRLRMDGTQAAGRLRGKTGTLENVSALSGYVRTPRGEQLAYSILVNDFAVRHRQVVSSIDALAARIAGLGQVEPELEAVASSAPSEATNLSELIARAGTYAQLGRMADRRNLPFLRSALRTERDTVLRAVLADAIFRSDPEIGASALLENLPRSAEHFARLRAVGQQLSIPTPLVSPLIDLAAEGHAEALERLVTLAHHARGDEATAAMLAEGLQEIGRTAPEELYEALRAANEELVASAVALLQQGISGTREKAEHPFLARLKSQGDAASPAMLLYERIHRAMVEAARAPALPAPGSCEGPACDRRNVPPASLSGGGG